MPVRGFAIVVACCAGLACAGARADALRPEPVDYTRICNAYGEGYLVLPGTDACMQMSTRVRTDYNVFFNFAGDFDFEPNDGFDADQNAYRFRARGYVYTDVRKETPFGGLHAYTQFRFTKNNASDVVVRLYGAFVELGGVTAGRTPNSFYDFLGVQFSQAEFFDPQFSRNDPQTVLAYQRNFGHGLRAALAIEDTTGHQSPIASGGRIVSYAGTQIPDVVLRLQAGTDHDPAYAQLMAATHYVNTVANGLGSTGEALGFAVGAGVASDVPLGSGTRVGLTATFARGARRYATTSASAPDGLAGDAVFDPATQSALLSDFLSVALGGRTDLAPDWELAAQVGFLYGDPAGGTPIDIDRNGTLDDLSFINLDLQTFLKWQVNHGLFIGAGAEYRFVGTADFGTSSFLTTYLRAQATF